LRETQKYTNTEKRGQFPPFPADTIGEMNNFFTLRE